MAVTGIMKRTKGRTLDLDTKKLQEALQHAEVALNDEDYELFKALADSYAYLAELASDENMTTDRLREMLFGPGTEQTETAIDNGTNPETPRQGDRRSGGET